MKIIFFFFAFCFFIHNFYCLAINPKTAVSRINAPKHTLNQYLENSDCEFAILRSRPQGMFSIFGDVLCLCKKFEEGLYTGIEVDFMKTGLYYDESHGDNWWSYYCEPILFGEENKIENRIHEYIGFPFKMNIITTEIETTKLEANVLINKYIHINQEIQNEINAFVEENFL